MQVAADNEYFHTNSPKNVSSKKKQPYFSQIRSLSPFRTAKRKSPLQDSSPLTSSTENLSALEFASLQQKRESFELFVRASDLGPTTQALSDVLKDTLCRSLFRAHLQAMRMEEALDCLDEIDRFLHVATFSERVEMAKQIISTFCLDTSPRQVNLSGATKEILLASMDQAERLASETFFQCTRMEVLKDIRQSDAFRFFLEGGTVFQRQQPL